MKKTIIILGMGPGLSFAVAEKFGNEGFIVGMISRSQKKLEEYQEKLEKKNIRAYFAIADLANTEQMVFALKELLKVLGKVDVLMYNAVDYRVKHIMDETIEDLTNGFKVSVGNVLVAVKELLPQLEKSKGAVLLTGGGSANYPDANMGSISLGKAGIKNLAYQLSHALAEKGIFVGTVTVSGWINPGSSTHSPTIIADEFWKIYAQRASIEVVY